MYPFRQDIFNKLNSVHITKEGIETFYCDPLIWSDRCPFFKGRSCDDCYPTLERLLETPEDIKDPEAFVRWRLREHANGRLEPRYQDNKQPPRHWDKDIDPLSDAEQLIRKVTKNAEQTP